jgi:protein TonB
MTRDLVISGIFATAFHGLILSLPLAGGSNPAPFSILNPISMSIIRPDAPQMSPPKMSAASPPAPLATEPKPETKAPVSKKHTVIQKKQGISKPMSTKEDGLVSKKIDMAGNVHVTKSPMPVQKEPSALDEEGVSETASTAPNVETLATDPVPLTGSEGAMVAHQGDQKARDVVVYARPKYDENPVPPYPRVARKRGYTGETLLRVEVLETGKVGGIEVAKSSGFDVLDRAALKSVKKWGFVPGTKDGKNIRQWVVVPVRFSLE